MVSELVSERHYFSYITSHSLTHSLTHSLARLLTLPLLLILNQGLAHVKDSRRTPELTRTPRGLRWVRWVRTGYAYQPPALGTYRRRRAACPQGPMYYTSGVRVPASGVGYVPRTVAPQVARRSSPARGTCAATVARVACNMAPAAAQHWGRARDAAAHGCRRGCTASHRGCSTSPARARSACWAC